MGVEPQRQHREPLDERLDELDGSQFPESGRYSLIRQGGALTATIMADAWRDAGYDIEDPPEVKEYYFEDLGLLVIDLESEE